MNKCPKCGKEHAAGVLVCDVCQTAMPVSKVSLKKWFTMKKTTSEAAEISIYSDIGMWGVTAEMFIRELGELGDVKNLTIRINSYGGEVFDGNAIFNRLVEHSAHKTVIIDGIAASMASIIAMAGDVVKMPENTFLMIHDPSVCMCGNADAFEKTAKLLNQIKENAVNAYQRHAKDLSYDEIWDLMSEESWISASDAKLYGLIDEVIGAIDTAEPPTNTGRMIPKNLAAVLMSARPVATPVLVAPIVPVNIVSPVNKPAVVPPSSITGGLMNKCPKCGKEHAEGIDFCSSCGTAISLKAAHTREVEETKVAERNRVSQISKHCRDLNLEAAFEQQLIDSGKTVEECSLQIVEQIKLKTPQAPVQTNTPVVSVVTDDADTFRAHAVNCLSVVCGIERKPEVVAEVRKDQVVTGLHSLMQRVLQRAGVDPVGMSADNMFSRILNIGTSSSDLPAILAATANKSLAAGMEEAPVSFGVYAGSMEVPDFKAMNLVSMSNFGDIDDLPEGSNFKNAKVSDKQETAQVTTKGKKFNASRNALVNDDLDAIARIPRLMGNAVKRRMNRDVIDAITSNTLLGPLMGEDGVRLFNAASHFNLRATGGLPIIANISAAETLLMNMPLLSPEAGAGIQYSNLQGRYILTGTATKLGLEQVLNTPYDPAGSISGIYNPYTNNRIIPIFDAYLQAILTAGSVGNAWYLLTDQNAMETVGVAYLRGNRAPTLRGEPSRVGEALGYEWDIFFDWGVYFRDWRGIVYSDGATS